MADIKSGVNKLDLGLISTDAKSTIAKMVHQLSTKISVLGKNSAVSDQSMEEINSIISNIEELHKFILPRIKTIGSKRAVLASIVIKPLEKVYNLATTIRDTAEAGDDTSKMLPKFRKETAIVLDRVESSLDDMVHPTQKESSGVSTIWDRYNPEGYNVDSPNQKGQDVKLKDILRSDNAALAKYAVYAHRLPKAAQADKNGYTFSILPIIPLLNIGIPPSVFNKAGFEAGNIGGYPVFEDQAVIAISRDYAKDNDTTIKKVLDLALKSIELKHKKKYTLVNDKPSGTPKTPTLEYYWIMEDKVLSEFQSVAQHHAAPHMNVISKKIFVKDWNFPF